MSIITSANESHLQSTNDEDDLAQINPTFFLSIESLSAYNALVASVIDYYDDDINEIIKNPDLLPLIKLGY